MSPEKIGGEDGQRTVRAEELIAETYKQILAIQESGGRPERLIMNSSLWKIIEDYRRSLGVIHGPILDYLSEDRLFGLEIWYAETPGIRVE